MTPPIPSDPRPISPATPPTPSEKPSSSTEPHVDFKKLGLSEGWRKGGWAHFSDQEFKVFLKGLEKALSIFIQHETQRWKQIYEDAKQTWEDV